MAIKSFTKADVVESGSYPRIYADRSELAWRPTAWQLAGLQETASGYGSRLNTGLVIHYEGRSYRLYATCYSNVSSVWFTVKGRKIYVS